MSYCGFFSPERDDAVHRPLAGSLVSCLSLAPCSGTAPLARGQPQEVPPGTGSCGAGSWLQWLLGTRNEGDGAGPNKGDSGGVMHEQSVDITDPCFREVVNGESSYRGQVHPESDKFHGYGHYRCPEFDLVCHWEDGLAHGRGHQVWSRGGSFDGQFRSGMFNGHGRMQWPDRRGAMVYEGEYKDDHKHGHGRFSWPSGRCYVGQWANGQRHGAGDDISVDGSTRHSLWEDGVAVRAMPTAAATEPLELATEA